MCYKDMTFCTFYEDCAKATDCPRPLTPEVREAAAKWYGGDDYLIAMFMDKPGCWKAKENDDEK